MTPAWLPPVHSATPDDRERARLCLLDWLAVAAAGQQRLAALLPAAHAGPGPADAARRSGTAGHLLDYDDTMPSALAHPSAVLWPALLAQPLSGTGLVDGFLRGVEGFAHWGGRYAAAIAERRGHPTASLGVLAATYASACALGHDTRAVWEGLRLAGALAAGSQSVFGTPGKALQVGHAARTAVEVVQVRWPSDDPRDLADPVTLPGGFAERMAGGVEGQPPQTPGDHPVHDVVHKFHASCYATHGALDAFSGLGVRADDIEAIHVRIGADFPAVAEDRRPESGLALKFSMPACLALTVGGWDTADPATFESGLERDPRLRRLIERVACTAEPSIPSGAGAVTVRLGDGRVVEGFSDPGAAKPATSELRGRIEEKFRRLVAPLCGPERADEIVSLILDEGEVAGSQDVSSFLDEATGTKEAGIHGRG